MKTTVHMNASLSQKEKTLRQEPFARIAPLLKASLLLGAGGGFVLATILVITSALSLPLGPWWEALAQAHGQLQLYGWAGLFVLGVAFHFLPRLRGAPLAVPQLIPWVLSSLVAGLLLRAFSAPLITITEMTLWRIVLLISGVLQCAGQLLALVILVLTARRGPPIASRPAYRGILPFLIGAFCVFGIAGIINLVNMLQAAAGIGLVMSAGDDLNTTLGLLGFLMPMALAMSARSLPMYAGLEAFPQRVMWPLAANYLLGLIFACIGIGTEQLSILWLTMLEGLGIVLMGVVLIVFVGVFLRLMRSRGRLPQKVAQLAPQPARVARSYQIRVLNERSSYGSFVALVASAYLWAVLGALLLIIDGGTLLLGAQLPIAFDAIRHSFAIGFIALLICGIAPRMLPGFSGGHIASSKLVTATLWLGNIAALLRVGSILAAPAFVALGDAGHTLISLAFGLSGPVGLALAICLAINLWPALIASPKTQ